MDKSLKTSIANRERALAMPSLDACRRNSFKRHFSDRSFLNESKQMDSSAMASLPQDDSWMTIYKSRHSEISKGECEQSNDVTQMTPSAYLLFTLRCSLPHGFEAHIKSSLSIKNYFIEPTYDMLNAYDGNALSAIRSSEVQDLRDLHSAGKSFSACNRFGESLLHLACRRGREDVVCFLIEEAGVSPKLRDDYGRTPLHDAFWTPKPVVKTVECLVNTAPDLLLMSDKRGHTPLEYIRKEHFSTWIKVLARLGGEALSPKRKEFLSPIHKNPESPSLAVSAHHESTNFLAAMTNAGNGEEEGILKALTLNGTNSKTKKKKKKTSEHHATTSDKRNRKPRRRVSLSSRISPKQKRGGGTHD